MSAGDPLAYKYEALIRRAFPPVFDRAQCSLVLLYDSDR